MVITITITRQYDASGKCDALINIKSLMKTNTIVKDKYSKYKKTEKKNENSEHMVHDIPSTARDTAPYIAKVTLTMQPSCNTRTHGPHVICTRK